MQLERTLTKDEILTLYLASRPMAATWKAFARPRSPISGTSRAACRSAKPRSWWRFRSRPRRGGRTALADAARRAARRVLDRVAAGGRVPADEVVAGQGRARARRRASPMPVFAPHAADQAIARLPSAANIGSPSTPRSRAAGRPRAQPRALAR